VLLQTAPKMSEQKGTQDEDLLDQLLATLGKLEVTDDNKEDQEKPEEPTSSKAKKKEQKKQLSQDDSCSLTLESIAQKIRNGSIKRIITMAGAGISTSAGIPDFRSEGCGLYSTINQKFPELAFPEQIFYLDFFKRNPHPFYEFAKELLPPAEGEGYEPTPCHKFIKKLNDKKLLVRHYTQNIDGLEWKAGLPDDKLIEAHGSFRNAHCIKCRAEYTEDFIREKLSNPSGNVIPRCTRLAGCQGLVKPDIVFGEGLPERFFTCLEKDFKKCDLLIIMGTSLTVHPFASLIDMVKPSCPRLLINFDNESGAFNVEPPADRRNHFLQGTCDEGCQKLEELLEWNKEE